jgi:hypothetical protein
MTAKTDVIEPASAAASAPVGEKQEEKQYVGMVTILYSRDCDLYRVPSMDKPCWLSVTAYRLPATMLTADWIYLGPATTADGQGWRKAYALSWSSIVPGDRTTLPADHPLVLDYAAAPFPSRERAASSTSPAPVRKKAG